MMAFFYKYISFKKTDDSWIIRPEKTFWLPKKQNLSIMLCHHLDMIWRNKTKSNFNYLHIMAVMFIFWYENFPEAKIKD